MSDVKISPAVKEAADKAKASGFEVSFTKIAGKEFLFRPVNRQEWRGLLKARNAAMLAAGEDKLKQAEVLEQELENLLTVSLIYPDKGLETLPAGTVQTLCDAIMVASGFTGTDSEPVKL